MERLSNWYARVLCDKQVVQGLFTEEHFNTLKTQVESLLDSSLSRSDSQNWNLLLEILESA